MAVNRLDFNFISFPGHILIPSNDVTALKFQQ
uniref:Uncharacterized protein n=1 Tax=Rhizophora mucronata TaxID=61149 RepID=A0A2P2N723_RHIMU